MLEYVEQPLRKSLTDLSAYVRKAAVMGILKVDLGIRLFVRRSINYFGFSCKR